ncbi:hypothetical protein [Streptomyces sp. SDr-06]|nr:hypothetical protein [Streptomyces sp. SDr-06]
MADFQDRMSAESEQVYQRILSGDCVDVEAELFDAQLRASSGEEEA